MLKNSDFVKGTASAVPQPPQIDAALAAEVMPSCVRLISGEASEEPV